MPNIPHPQISRSARSSISLQVTKDGELLVKAPFFAPTYAINHFIEEKRDWILQTLEKVQAHQTKAKQYREGEEFWYLGEPRELKFYGGLDITVKGQELLFPKVLQFRIQKELSGWFLKHAREKITERVIYHAEKMNASYTELMFSDTKSKWGTCFPDNSLQFNWRLIMAPLMVLDYVVIHELTHTTEKNHSSDFWRRVSRYTPAWRQHRKWLNTNAHLLAV